MKILLLALSFQSVTAPDRWFSADKVQHFFIGTFVQSASFGVLRVAKVDKSAALIGASALSAATAIGKELRDRGGRGDVSAKDAAWTLMGAAAISPVLARTR
jgi:uncharacterized protein YfiM (DUF2279 family)